MEMFLSTILNLRALLSKQNPIDSKLFMIMNYNNFFFNNQIIEANFLIQNQLNARN